ncbi:hypothetical protein ACFORH_42630 [Amycolatopsis roodepoortensis]|uniref:Amphi-Trp domain-containing protein n=1 Tax=Amycolatopsis roodepoortensis TaxID=700274 RepID=A0ABR9L458_9PSEU|nr:MULTISPECIES: hypothetical protein [Amycolatopsis]MBE1575050.1 hypothetical protein [Amycolatopsis roodepoortensis]GHG97287.1 hypothetical protein GCM10017788_76690 [Amycolatopsis acidiphila]
MIPIEDPNQMADYLAKIAARLRARDGFRRGTVQMDAASLDVSRATDGVTAEVPAGERLSIEIEWSGPVHLDSPHKKPRRSVFDTSDEDAYWHSRNHRDES